MNFPGLHRPNILVISFSQNHIIKLANKKKHQARNSYSHKSIDQLKVVVSHKVKLINEDNIQILYGDLTAYQENKGKLK